MWQDYVLVNTYNVSSANSKTMARNKAVIETNIFFKNICNSSEVKKKINIYNLTKCILNFAIICKKIVFVNKISKFINVVKKSTLQVEVDCCSLAFYPV